MGMQCSSSGRVFRGRFFFTPDLIALPFPSPGTTLPCSNEPPPMRKMPIRILRNFIHKY